MRQALWFMDHAGLRLHQTMFAQRLGGGPITSDRYTAYWAYTYVFSKGKPAVSNIIKDKRNRTAGSAWNDAKTYGRRGDDQVANNPHTSITPVFGARGAVWEYATPGGHLGAKDEPTAVTAGHPSPFPYALVADHIRTWSNPGDLVLDPMAGSGTALRAAVNLGRQAVGVEVNPDYCDIINERMRQETLL